MPRCADSLEEASTTEAQTYILVAVLPHLVCWLRRGSLGAVQASLGRVLRVLLLHTILRLVEARVPKITVLRGLLHLAEATLRALALEAVKITRWNS